MEESKVIAVEIVSNGFSISDIVNIGALAIAFIAVIASIFSNWQTSKYNKLTQDSNEMLYRQFARGLPQLKVTSVKHQTMKYNSKKYFSIDVEISNLSENSNSIKRAELHISKRESSQGGKFVMQSHKEIVIDGRQYFTELPIQIDSGESIKKTFYFFIDNNILNPINVDEYKIALIDTFENEVCDKFINLRGVTRFE